MVSIFLIFIPAWGNDPISLIQMGWNHQLVYLFLGNWIAGFGVHIPRTFVLGTGKFLEPLGDFFQRLVFSRKNWKNLDLPVAQKKSEPYR